MPFSQDTAIRKNPTDGTLSKIPAKIKKEGKEFSSPPLKKFWFMVGLGHLTGT